jgi:tetratricopeptide (TPR) repeat protein
MRGLRLILDHVNALSNKGVALDNLLNHTGAIEYYDKALAIDPRNVNALIIKGLALDKRGNHTGAIQYFDKVLAIDPHDVSALNSEGIVLYDLGKYHDTKLSINLFIYESCPSDEKIEDVLCMQIQILNLSSHMIKR